MMAGRLRYLRRTHDERVLFLRAAVSLAVCRISLKVLSFGAARRLLRLIARPRPSRVQTDGAPLVKVQWAIGAAGRRMPWAVTCLTTAICTQALSEHLGERTLLKIGVAKDGAGEFTAHAWVESEGVVISGALGDLPKFTILASFAGDAD
jgi:hypothetical protein